MWLLNYRFLSKILPVLLLVLITCITYMLRSINNQMDEKQEPKEETDADVEVEINDEDDVEVEAEEKSIVSTPITQIEGLPPKAIKALQTAKILTVEQAEGYTDEELLELNGIGKKSLEKIRIFKI